MSMQSSLLALVLLLRVVWSADAQFSVNDFGAQGDGLSDDTESFAATWEAACSSSSPVTILVPAGQTYRLKQIKFSGPCQSDVTVSIQGIILASDQISDWDGLSSRVWIMFDTVNGLSVVGGGTINGNGPTWWNLSCKFDKTRPCTTAPTAMTFKSCNRLIVSDLNLKDSQQIHVTVSQCAGVSVSRLSISARGDSPNTDGIHITRSTNVTISDTVVGTGDDCISIVSNSSFITARNIFCGPGHGISIGSLGQDGRADTISDVLVDTALLVGTTNGVRIKTWQGGRGYAKNIAFKNIMVDNVRYPLIIDQNYCLSNKSCGEQISAVAVSGITYQNIVGTSATPVAIKLDCSKTVWCNDIVLNDINLVVSGGKAAKSICSNVNLIKYGTVVPSDCGQ